MCKLLIVDDNKNVAFSLKDNYVHFGFKCDIAKDSVTATNMVLNNSYSCIILDLKLGSENGLELLKKFKCIDDNLPIILVTGFGTIDTAVEAIKSGAYDYIEKPINFEKLLVTTNNAIELLHLKNEVSSLSKMIKKHNIVTQSPKMMQLIENTIILAKTELPILLLGESGSGKELFAELIHMYSPSSNKEMQKINSAAFAETLLDNELFGHEKDAYTGASSVFQGIFERAHQSSLFLDEIGDMPLSIQAKILRAIQNKEIRRLGGSKNITISTRFIAATNKDIEKLIQAGKFREDLYYRLNTGMLYIPSLRERTEDIPILCRHFITDHCEKNSCEPKIITDEVYSFLTAYSWPGNIRELKSTILYSLSLSHTNRIDVGDLPPYLSKDISISGTTNSLPETERKLIIEVLKQTRYNKTKAAQVLNISRRTLYNKMEAYGIL
jgi:DNA-binding NtrC family response regulator